MIIGVTALEIIVDNFYAVSKNTVVKDGLLILFWEWSFYGKKAK